MYSLYHVFSCVRRNHWNSGRAYQKIRQDYILIWNGQIGLDMQVQVKPQEDFYRSTVHRERLIAFESSGNWRSFCLAYGVWSRSYLNTYLSSKTYIQHTVCCIYVTAVAIKSWPLVGFFCFINSSKQQRTDFSHKYLWQVFVWLHTCMLLKSYRNVFVFKIFPYMPLLSLKNWDIMVVVNSIELSG